MVETNNYISINNDTNVLNINRINNKRKRNNPSKVLEENQVDSAVASQVETVESQVTSEVQTPILSQKENQVVESQVLSEGYFYFINFR